MSDAELERVLPGYDAVIVRSVNRVTRRMLETSPRVAVVGRAGSGVDNIDLNAAQELGVPVVNAPTGNAGSVAGQILKVIHNLHRCVFWDGELKMVLILVMLGAGELTRLLFVFFSRGISCITR